MFRRRQPRNRTQIADISVTGAKTARENLQALAENVGFIKNLALPHKTSKMSHIKLMQSVRMLFNRRLVFRVKFHSKALT